MKRIVTIFFAAACIFGLLSGCRSNPVPMPSGSAGSSPSKSSSSSSASSSPSSSAGSAKTGLAVITSLSSSKDAGKDNGLAEFDSTVVAVTVNKEGKIQKCAIDAVQSQIYFDAKGQLITPVNTKFKTKNELGDAVGLKKASGIGKEWYEQAAAFAKYVEGMTADEVKSIRVDERNCPTQADLKASVTISIGGFIDGIEKAISKAQNGGAAASDRLSIGIVSSMSNSVSANADQPGLAQVDTAYVVLTRDPGGKISSCLLDESESGVSFTSSGKITTDTSVKPQTKNEIGDALGLKQSSAIGKEWYEQAAAFAKYVTGKTSSEINGIAVDNKGYPVSTDIKSSVTIGVGDFKAAILKAMSAV